MIKQHVGTNFNDFVNGYRINAFKENVEENNQHRTLLAVTLGGGFNSKATFNRAPEKFTGTSPRGYINEELGLLKMTQRLSFERLGVKDKTPGHFDSHMKNYRIAFQKSVFNSNELSRQINRRYAITVLKNNPFKQNNSLIIS